MKMKMKIHNKVEGVNEEDETKCEQYIQRKNFAGNKGHYVQ